MYSDHQCVIAILRYLYSEHQCVIAILRLPIVQGGTISFLVPTLAILNLPQWRCPDSEVLQAMTADNRTELWQVRMRELSGAIAVSALLQVAIGYLGVIGVMLRYITPLTIVPTVSLVGLSLFENAAEAASKHWGIAMGTILMLTVFSQCMAGVSFPTPTYNTSRGVHIAWFPLFKLFPNWDHRSLLFPWRLSALEQTSPAFRTSFIVGMSSGSSSISSSPSSSMDSCCSLIISASSRVPQTVTSSSAAMYSSYVQSEANLCQVSSSHGRVKVRGADIGAVNGPTCGSVEGPGWELASTGGGSFGSLVLAAVGSTWTAASSSIGKTKWACRKQLVITAGCSQQNSTLYRHIKVSNNAMLYDKVNSGTPASRFKWLRSLGGLGSLNTGIATFSPKGQHRYQAGTSKYIIYQLGSGSCTTPSHKPNELT
uniref:Uncharacterized protein n=1 Tax=Timema monikensis TaxID=170555 RepID=A0A7R9E8R2_9NEOP|nr:unnamed protein product [Timema monikensis]